MKPVHSIFVTFIPSGGNITSIYYRIKTIDLDGTAGYSKVMTVNVPVANATLVLFPNPAAAATLIHFNQFISDPVVSVFDRQGGKVYSTQRTGLVDVYKLSTAGLSNELYTVVVQGGNKRLMAQLMIVK